MARSTAPSMWLPGFDPEPLDLFVPATEADLAVESVPATDDGDFEGEVSSTSARSSWRAVTPTDQAAARVLWPQLTRAAQVEAQGEAFKAIVHHGNFVAMEITAPAVISIMPEAFKGTFANGWRLMDAYKQIVVDIWRAEELGLSEDDLRTLTAKKEDAFPPERQLGTPVRSAKELVMMLKREKIIA